MAVKTYYTECVECKFVNSMTTRNTSLGNKGDVMYWKDGCRHAGCSSTKFKIGNIGDADENEIAVLEEKDKNYATDLRFRHDIDGIAADRRDGLL